MLKWALHLGSALDVLKTLPDESVHCIVTSPPYFRLRDYGVDGQIGLEPTPDEFVAALVAVFSEARRVLRDDGTLWLNLGDSYAGGNTGGKWREGSVRVGGEVPGDGATSPRNRNGIGAVEGMKPKDLIGIPWAVAFALRADGWYLRADIIWCLSGGTRVYARTQKGEMPMTIKDLVRLDPSTVQLWNGEKWTQVLGWNESKRGHPLEIELRSGERIGCTAGHLWPTQRGNVRADELRVGDVIQSTHLPEPETPYSPAFIGNDVAWMLGLYLAEGSRDGAGRLQFAGHAEQNEERMAALRPLAEAFGGTARSYTNGNSGNVVVDCPALAAVVEQYIHGRSARTKGIKVRAWRHSDEWLRSLLRGYLDGDGHYDAPNDRWRLCFTRNDRLADDLRTLAARLGYTLTLKATTAEGYGKRSPVYRGEIRKTRSGHHNERPRTEVVAIRRSRARKFWDIGVADEPHLFALASGVLTHNSKPNPMPESVRDRVTKAHEYVFHLTKSARYFYDADAIREVSAPSTPREFDVLYEDNEWKDSKGAGAQNPSSLKARIVDKQRGHSRRHAGFNDRWDAMPKSEQVMGGANARSVWSIATQPSPYDHFAVMPKALARKCILAGCPQDGTVLDPFAGMATTGVVALEEGRSFVGIELNPNYHAAARQRLAGVAPLLAVEVSA